MASAPIRFAAVVSTYHSQYNEAMLASSAEVLKDYPFEVVRVPGAFEIPLAVQRLARTKRYAAVLAFGVVWNGKTRHAEEILRACTDALMRISLENDLPVLHEILSVGSVAEVRARTMGKLNRGIEAARAALAVTVSPAQPTPTHASKLKSGQRRKRA